MPDGVRWFFFLVGAALLVVGVVLSLLEPSSPSDHSVKLFGFEVHVSSTPLAITLIGLIMAGGVWLLPERDEEPSVGSDDQAADVTNTDSPSLTPTEPSVLPIEDQVDPSDVEAPEPTEPTMTVTLPNPTSTSDALVPPPVPEPDGEAFVEIVPERCR